MQNTEYRMLVARVTLALLLSFLITHHSSLITGVEAASVTLTWDEPTTNVDGSALTDLKEINLYQDGVKVKSVPASAATGGGVNQTTTVTVDDPVQGTVKTYSWHATAVDTAGNESGPSNVVSKTYDKQPPGQLKKLSLQ